MRHNTEKETHNQSKPSGLPKEDEIDLKAIISQLWQNRKFILITTSILFLIGVLIAFISPVLYTANCTVVPQSGKANTGGNLGGIAVIMGVNIGVPSVSGELLSPSIYPQIVKSVPFTKEIMQSPITVDKAGENNISLYDYYTNKDYQSVDYIGSIKKHTLGLPGLLIGMLKNNSNTLPADHTHSGDSSNIISLSKEEANVYRAIQNSIQLTLHQQEGYITIGYTFPEAIAAAQITDVLRITLEEYVSKYKLEKVEDDLLFVKQSLNDAQKDFIEKQNKLTTFQDANRGLTTAAARATEQRIRSEYEISFTIYNELAKQHEQAKLAVKETKPIFTVIEPTIVPLQKSAPKRSLILGVSILLGLIVSVVWIFLRSFFSKE